MRLLRLKIRNFMSFAEAELDLDGRGVVLVEGVNLDLGGSNGAGKTSLFEAISWGLYGTTNIGLRTAYLQRWEAPKMIVEVELEAAGRHLVVLRQRDQGKTYLDLTIDGVPSTQASLKDTQQKFLKLLQMDWLTFQSVILFPQGATGIAGQTDRDQKFVFDQLLDLERFNRGREAAKAFHSEVSSLHNELRAALAILEAERISKQEHITSLEKKQTEWTEGHAKAIAVLRNKILLKKQEEVPEPLKEREERAEIERELAESQKDEALDLIAKADHQLIQLKSEKQQIGFEIRAIREKIDNLQFFDNIEERIKAESVCPTCQQKLPHEAIINVSRHYHGINASSRQHRDRFLSEIAEKEERLKKLEEEIRSAEAWRAGQAQDTLQKIRFAESALLEVNQRISLREAEIRQWKADFDGLQRDLEALDRQVDPYGDLIEQARKQLESVERRIVEKAREKEPLEDDLAYAKFWLEGFGPQGIKPLLISTVTPYLNERANLYLSELTNNNASMRISTQKQNKDGEWRDRMGIEVRYRNGPPHYKGKSGGERRRVDVAVLFALGDLAAMRANGHINIRILDEVFESLDGPGCEQVIGLLKRYVIPRAGSIFLMSHDDSLKQLIEERIRVVKESGISRLEE